MISDPVATLILNPSSASSLQIGSRSLTKNTAKSDFMTHANTGGSVWAVSVEEFQVGSQKLKGVP